MVEGTKAELLDLSLQAAPLPALPDPWVGEQAQFPPAAVVAS